MLQRETNTTSGKTTLILPKRCQKLMSSKCSSFWLTTYFLCLVGMFFNRQSAYLWVLTVHFFSPTCSFIRTRQTSYRGLLNKCGMKLDPSFNFTFRDIDDVLPLNNIEPADYRTVIRKQMTSTINLYFRIFQSCFFFYSTHATKLLLYSGKDILDTDINLTNPTTTKGISI